MDLISIYKGLTVWIYSQVQSGHTGNDASRMVQGRALTAMQLMDARQATCSVNLSYLQALLANLFFSFRDFVLSCKKLLFWNDLGSRMVSDRPILALKVDLFFQSFRLHWFWKSEESGFAENLTENFQFLVSWQNAKSLRKMAPIFCFSLILGVFSHLVGKGTSLTGVKELISLFNFSSSFPAREENYDDKCF